MKKYFPAFVLPTFISFTVVFLIPFLMGIYLSFTEFTTVESATWIGFENYIRAFTKDENFLNALWFTIKFTIVSVITINVSAFALALLLTKALKGTTFFRTVFFMPNLIGGIVLGYIWNLLINAILGVFGFDITYDADYGFWGLVFLLNWQLIGYMMVIYIAGLQNVSAELYEAGAIDGIKTRWHELWYITMPSMKTILLFSAVMQIQTAFSMGTLQQTLVGYPSVNNSVDTLVLLINDVGTARYEMGYAAALSVFLFIVIIIFRYTISALLNLVGKSDS